MTQWFCVHPQPLETPRGCSLLQGPSAGLCSRTPGASPGPRTRPRQPLNQVAGLGEAGAVGTLALPTRILMTHVA